MDWEKILRNLKASLRMRLAILEEICLTLSSVQSGFKTIYESMSSGPLMKFPSPLRKAIA